VRETHKITIDNPDEGTFRIQFTSPDLKRSISDEMRVNMNGNQISDKIKKYFNSVGLNTVTTRKDFDANGDETEVAEDIVKRTYEIKLDRLVAAPSTSAMVISKGTTKSTVTLEANVVVSNPPMSGQW
jgi:hypothetical protein